MTKLTDALAAAAADPQKPKTYVREKGVESHLKARAEKLGGEVRKVSWVGRNGAPDRMILFPNGVLYWIETKAPQGRLSPGQRKEHIRMANMGQVVLVLWNRKLVDEFFDGIAPVLAAACEIHEAVTSITH